MKLPRLITRPRVKWVGIVITVVVGLVYVISLRAEASIWCGDFRYGAGCGIGVGVVSVVYSKEPDLPLDWNNVQASFNDTGRWRHGDLIPTLLWQEQGPRALQGPRTLRVLICPLWLPLLLIAAPTAWLWYTDRRAKPWQCPKCRYDLRGLDGGVCPECGESRQFEP